MIVLNILRIACESHVIITNSHLISSILHGSPSKWDTYVSCFQFAVFIYNFYVRHLVLYYTSCSAMLCNAIYFSSVAIFLYLRVKYLNSIWFWSEIELVCLRLQTSEQASWVVLLLQFNELQVVDAKLPSSTSKVFVVSI